MHSTFSQIDICWHSYGISSSSILNSYLTEKPQRQADLGFKWELPTRANSGHIGTIGKISLPSSTPLRTAAGMMEWRCCSTAAPSYWKPAARVRERNAQEPRGVAATTAATCKTQAERTTGINQPYDNNATCSAMRPSARTLRRKSRPPPKPLPAPSLLCVNCQLGWNQFVLFFFLFWERHRLWEVIYDWWSTVEF